MEDSFLTLVTNLQAELTKQEISTRVANISNEVCDIVNKLNDILQQLVNSNAKLAKQLDIANKTIELNEIRYNLSTQIQIRDSINKLIDSTRSPRSSKEDWDTLPKQISIPHNISALYMTQGIDVNVLTTITSRMKVENSNINVRVDELNMYKDTVDAKIVEYEDIINSLEDEITKMATQ